MLNLSEYAGVLVFLLLGITFITALLCASYFVRERGSDPERNKVYECGMETIGTPYVSPNIRFYVFALMFVIFDVEAIFVLPWAVSFWELGWVGYTAVLIFIGILTVPFAYAWRKGALQWE